MALAGPAGPRRLVREHAAFTIVLAAGLIVRLAIAIGYPRAFRFADSVYYLHYADPLEPGTARVSGYSILLRPLLELQGLDLIAAVQQVVGLALGIGVYALARRCGVPKCWAALAAVPVLLDPLQTVLEKYVLADVWAEALIVAAVLLLGWRAAMGEPRPEPRRDWLVPAAAGLLLGVATVVRSPAAPMVVIAVGYVLLTGTAWRRRAGRSVLLAVAFALPVLAYMSWMQAERGPFALTESASGHFLYGRVAQFADCTRFDPGADLRALCPSGPSPARQNFLMWNAASPQWAVPRERHLAGAESNELARRFAIAAIRARPLAYAGTVGRDFIANFGVTCCTGPEHVSTKWLRVRRHQPAQYPSGEINRYGGPSIPRPGFATPMWAYAKVYVPGAVFGIALLIGLVAGLGATRRARRSGLRSVCLLLCAAALTTLLMPALFATYDVRYSVVLLPLAPLAGVLGLRALRGPAVGPAAGNGHTGRTGQD
ncbi:MAG: phospholipid carrier-dependent glycosyltransferase [Mycobacteriales bacterium]